MGETDTEFLSRIQGQAAHPDMTRLLALAAEAVRLELELESQKRVSRLWRGWYENEVGVSERLRSKLAEARAALKKESTP